MGIFKMFKKKNHDPSDPPLPEKEIKPPIEIPTQDFNEEFNEEFQDPFESTQRKEEENVDFTNQDEIEAPMQENISDIPSPPSFDSFEKPFDDQKNDNQNLENIEKPFSAEVPDFKTSNNNEDHNGSSDLPDPFDSDFGETNKDQEKSFAEQFGTMPQEFNNEEEIDTKNSEEESNEINEDEQNTSQINPSFDQDSEETFSFSSNKQKQEISERELPLHHDITTKEFTDESPSEKIEKQIDDHVSELKGLDLETKKSDDFTFLNKTKSIETNKPKLSSSSFFIAVDGCVNINQEIIDIKNLVNYTHDINMKISDFEKKSEIEYSKWKKNMEEIYSSLFSIDKKLFR